MGLHTVEDLLYRFPIRYEDRGTFQTIAQLRPGVTASVLGEVVGSGIRPTRRPRFKIFELVVRDQTGALRAIWFNQPFLNDVFRPHQRVILFGKLELTSHGLQLQNPQYEVLPQATDDGEATVGPDDDTLHTGRIVPIYEKTGTVTTKMQRVLVHHALAQLPDVLPDPLPDALRARHDAARPPSRDRAGALSARARQSRRAERVSLAGAAAADLRGVLSLPVRPGAAEAPGERGGQATGGRHH